MKYSSYRCASTSVAKTVRSSCSVASSTCFTFSATSGGTSVDSITAVGPPASSGLAAAAGAVDRGGTGDATDDTVAKPGGVVRAGPGGGCGCGGCVVGGVLRTAPAAGTPAAGPRVRLATMTATTAAHGSSTAKKATTA